MGKKKFDQIQLVPNKNQRNVTYSKRKRGILKKAIELSVLCGQDIFLVIFDKQKQKLIEFRSSMEFNTKIVDSLTQKDIALHFKHEVYNNEDYSRFLQNHDNDAESDKDDPKNDSKQDEDVDQIEDPEAYAKIKEELKNYIKPECQKKFRRKVVEKRECKLQTAAIQPKTSSKTQETSQNDGDAASSLDSHTLNEKVDQKSVDIPKPVATPLKLIDQAPQRDDSTAQSMLQKRPFSALMPQPLSPQFEIHEAVNDLMPMRHQYHYIVDQFKSQENLGVLNKDSIRKYFIQNLLQIPNFQNQVPMPLDEKIQLIDAYLLTITDTISTQSDLEFHFEKFYLLLRMKQSQRNQTALMQSERHKMVMLDRLSSLKRLHPQPMAPTNYAAAPNRAFSATELLLKLRQSREVNQ